jgi:uncharacterized OB-fold protein
MSDTTLPTPAPPVNSDTKPFWDATAEGTLLLKRCDSCGVTIWYPRPICPACGSTETSWYEGTGRGTVYSFTITRRGDGLYREITPYVLAYVELAEGPRMLTNIVDADLDTLAIGDAVEVVFHDTGEGSAIPRFRPARN